MAEQGQTKHGSEWVYVQSDQRGNERATRVVLPDALRVVNLRVNGAPLSVPCTDPRLSLCSFLREHLHLTGTKRMCGEGGCGCCTVLELAPSQEVRPVLSCLRPIASCNERAFLTIEGVRDRAVVAPLIASHFATQCGYCTPGMVNVLEALLQRGSAVTDEEIEEQLDGNLCRCTGYRPIFTAARAALSAKSSDRHCCGSSCSSAHGSHADAMDMEDLCGGGNSGRGLPARALPRTLAAGGSGAGATTWLTASSVDEVLAALRTYPASTVRFSAGNTAHGVIAIEDSVSVMIDVSRIRELNAVADGADGSLHVGAAVSLADTRAALRGAKRDPGVEEVWKEAAAHFGRIGGHALRAAGTVGGSVMLASQTPSFTSDTLVILAGLGTVAHLLSADGRRRSLAVEDLPKIGGNELKSSLLLSLSIPNPSIPPRGCAKGAPVLKTFKIALRRQNAHAMLNAALFARICDDERFGDDIRLVFGGVGAFAVRARRAEEALRNTRRGDPAAARAALRALAAELPRHATVDADGRVPVHAHSSYAATVAPGVLFKFLLAMQRGGPLPCDEAAARMRLPRELSHGTQRYADGPAAEAPVGRPVPKLAALAQARGEAVYTNDPSPPAGCLFGAYVAAPCAPAVLDGCSADEALRCTPGAVAFVDAAALAAAQCKNALSADEELLVSRTIQFAGQAVGIVLATTQDAADAAARRVVVHARQTGAPVLDTLDAARRGDIYAGSQATRSRGTARACHASTEEASSDTVRVHGTARTGHQYHFFMETHACTVVPVEGGRLWEVCSSTQYPLMVQQTVAGVLGAPLQAVRVRTERVGGGFGGKLTRAAAIAAACAACSAVAGAPVRISLPISAAMRLVGGRAAYALEYDLSITRDGRISSADLSLWYNQGACSDLGGVDCGAALDAIDNCYAIPRMQVRGACVRTQCAPATAMRGPGFVEAIALMETAVEHAARVIGLSPEEVRERNFYRPGDTALCGQRMPYANVRELWAQLRSAAGWEARVAAAAADNRANRFVKRGLAMVPIKYLLPWAGVNYNALVNIYTDGSVRILHSGIEIGQGIDTKVAQVAADTLGVPLAAVSVGRTTTDTAVNTQATGGSIASELNSRAVKAACKDVLGRIDPIRKLATPGASWSEVIAKCAAAGVDLQGRGYSYASSSPEGPYQYTSFGVAVCEATVDGLTGEWQINRADILLDCGDSLNPMIDIGQCEGGFVQGMGLFLSEQFRYNGVTGDLLTAGTWEYKPPCSQDIPAVLNVSLVQNHPNPLGFMRSKASGEPPYALSCAAMFAVQRAVDAVRAEVGLHSPRLLSAPATVDRIRDLAGVTVEHMTFEPLRAGSAAK